MHPFLRVFFFHAATGFLVGVLCSIGVTLLDIGNIGTLIQASDVGWIAFALMTFKLGVTFGAAQVGIAVFTGGFERE